MYHKILPQRQNIPITLHNSIYMFKKRSFLKPLCVGFTHIEWRHIEAPPIPNFIGISSPMARYTLEPFHTSCTVDWTSVLPGDRIYIVTIIVAVLVLPLGLIITCYIAIARKLYRHQLQLRQRRSRNHSTFIQFRNENRLIVVSVCIC